MNFRKALFQQNDAFNLIIWGVYPGHRLLVDFVLLITMHTMDTSLNQITEVKT